jgi:hypothetical protein
MGIPMKPRWMLTMIFALVLQNAIQNTTEIASAQEFRIETDLYLDKDAEKPSSENLTLFSDSIVYDFQLPPQGETPVEVVIYNSQKEEFVLLDPSRKLKCLVTKEKIDEIVAAMRNDAVMQKKIPHLLNPNLTEHFDEETQYLILKNDKLTYRVRGKDAKNSMPMKSYYEFIDQYALLNVTDPRKIPPFARLEVNSAIKERGWMPRIVEFEMEMRPNVFSRKQKLNLMTKHDVIWRLSKTDRKRIENAKDMWSTYASVDLDEYRQLGSSKPTAITDSGKSR